MQITPKEVRKKILECGMKAGQAHLGGALSSVELLLVLYNDVLRKQDKFIFSKGHCPLVLYTILEECGYLKNKTDKYGTLEMPGHADHQTNGVEITTGSLGYGLGVGCGYALSSKLDKKDSKTYVLLGDTECTEGSIWEAVMFASSIELNNLVAIVDNNKLGVLGPTNKYASKKDMVSKWQGFGWNVYEIDGHNIKEILMCFEQINKIKTKKPSVIIANTVKGKGISFLENQPRSHHGIPQGEELKQACKELGVKQ